MEALETLGVGGQMLEDVLTALMPTSVDENSAVLLPRLTRIVAYYASPRGRRTCTKLVRARNLLEERRAGRMVEFSVEIGQVEEPEDVSEESTEGSDS